MRIPPTKITLKAYRTKAKVELGVALMTLLQRHSRSVAGATAQNFFPQITDKVLIHNMYCAGERTILRDGLVGLTNSFAQRNPLV
jgi:hypothetical protein